jgi:transposase
MEVLSMSSTVRKQVLDAIWSAVEPHLPAPPPHPLGCHRPRTDDRAVFDWMILKLVTGCSWEDAAQETMVTSPRTSKRQVVALHCTVQRR